MKKILTLAALFSALFGKAQWSNTTNQFYDSLFMQVAVAPASQRNPLVLPSYPDGGYFVIWEDDRNINTTKTDIYAQKYDATGKRLWADNGIPVANGPNAQHYTFPSNQDYRNRSFAATDSAGGFYLCYVDDSVTNYYWSRIAVQHVQKKGTAVFPGAGYIVATTPANENYSYSSPLLIPDGAKGFYIGYIQNFLGASRAYVYCYKDEGGVMKAYGGGLMNENAVQRSQLTPCGIRLYIDYPGTTVNEYAIWPDRQGGCNIIMSMNGNVGDQGPMLAFNKVFRAKKKSIVKTFRRNTSGYACPRITQYDSGKVYVQYYFDKDRWESYCGTPDNVYVVASERILSVGYLLLDIGGYDYLYPKGISLATDGNIGADVMAVMTRSLKNNSVTDYFLKGYAYPNEIYDSVPYQRAAYSNPDFGYNTKSPQKMNKLAVFRDTILGTGIYYPDFSLAGGGGNVYAASLIGNGGARNVCLQYLQLEKESTGSYALSIKTRSKLGEVIGKEVSSGFTGTSISYDHPMIAVDDFGQGVFYIRNYYGSAQISPIVNGTELAWGAMGRSIGTAVFNAGYYNLDQPYFSVHSFIGDGLLAFRENRFVPGTTYENISARHIDSLKELHYKPPYKPVLLVPNPYGGTYAHTAVLTGSSNEFSLIEIYSPSAKAFQIATPFAELLDNFNFGTIQSNLFQNTGAVRRYNGKAYLDRNFSLSAENDPAGKAYINLRLFFTKTEFDALKAADASIKTPSDLLIVQQPVTSNIPSAYTPVAGEQAFFPVTWKAVDSGYYVETRATALGNFFLLKGESVQLCPGGSGSIVSNLSGSSYQWQIGTGSSFVNLSNGGNYGGVNSSTLQLTGMPSSLSGLQFRCVVDGVNSNVTVLRFANTWTGAVDNDWNKAGNWSCGSVPDQYTDVVINSGDIVVNGNVACRTLTINPGASLTVTSGHSLKVMF